MAFLADLAQIVIFFAIFVFGCLFGWLFISKIHQGKIDDAQTEAEKITRIASAEAETLKKTALLEAREEWRKEQLPLEHSQEETKQELRNLESKLHEREQQLDRKVDVLESKERGQFKHEEDLNEREEQIKSSEEVLKKGLLEQNRRMEELASLSQADARKLIIAQQEDQARQLASRKVREIKDQALANGNREAREIMVRAIGRFVSEVAVESTVSVVNLPSDEMKGRIIGRDGRNIRSFEMITGVEVIVDDTPSVVTLSAFDLMRREIAKNTLTKLVHDGRIHPGRIEEVYEKACEDIEDLIREYGSKAAFDLGIHDFSEEILELLGQLHFRTNYGQNLLAHSEEVGTLAGMMAEELGLDVALARRAGLLHDIGKSLPTEVGSDTLQSTTNSLRKYGESPELIKVLEEQVHNNPMRSALSILIHSANEISDHRPRARTERSEDYIRRLKTIEDLALSFSGVTNAYVLQTGREIRVLVDSEKVDDIYMDQLADELTEKIDTEAIQPGQLKISVIRETRAVHYAR